MCKTVSHSLLNVTLPNPNVVWVIGHRLLVECRSLAADLAHPKILAWCPYGSQQMFEVMSLGKIGMDAGLKSLPPLTDDHINDGLTIPQPHGVSTHQHHIYTVDKPGPENSPKFCNRLGSDLSC